MKATQQRFGLCKKVLVLSLLAAFGTVYAQEDDDDAALQALKTPDSQFSLGLSVPSATGSGASLLNQYTGVKSNPSQQLLLDGDLIRRDDESGTWTRVLGRNLGLDDPEFQVTREKQGDWKLTGDYNAITRSDPRSITTSVQNAGSTTPTVNLANPAASVNLSTKREGVSLGGSKWITPDLLLEVDFKGETKNGARLSGTGVACYTPNNICAPGYAGFLGAVLMLPEPINSSIQQMEARLSYRHEALRLDGGYYLSLYSNQDSALTSTITGNLVNPNGSVLSTAGGLAGVLQQPLALEPSNQAQKLYVDGTYAFSPATRANFKLAYTNATQNAGFVVATAPAVPSSLNAAVNTTFAQAGLSTKATSQLSLLANLRYEDRADQTPVVVYANGLGNNPQSSTKWNGKLEANYQINPNYRATVGMDYDDVHRARPALSGLLTSPTPLVDPSLAGLRDEVWESTYRADLRRAMSDTLNGSVGLATSSRQGSSWFNPTTGFPTLVAAAGGTVPTTMEDRQRNVAKLAADWNPSKALSLQFMLQTGTDSYSGPVAQGMQDSGVQNYGVDAAWALNSKWSLTGYWNHSEQVLHVNKAAAYMAELGNVDDSISLGVVGKISPKYEVGASVAYTNDDNRYLLGAGNAQLPNITFNSTLVRLYTKYALDKNSDIRLDVSDQRVSFNDWAWSNGATSFSYSDASTVGLQPVQEVTFIGVTYVVRMK